MQNKFSCGLVRVQISFSWSFDRVFVVFRKSLARVYKGSIRV